MATHYSGVLAALLCCAGAILPSALRAQADFGAFYESRLQQARTRQQGDTNNVEAAVQLGRACFDRAEFATNDTQRATLAVEGIAVCRAAATREPKQPAAHYYLAMNLGQLARTKMLGALPLVDEMERHFKLARDLDPKLDHAGPERCLGLLYRDAPGWPASIGSKSKARSNLLRAVELAPDFPENRLNLLESALKWSDRKLVQSEVKAIEATLPVARTNLTGDAWAASWADWSRRWEAAQPRAKSLLKLPK